MNSKTVRIFISIFTLLALSINPARSVSAQGGTTASAVFVPAQVSDLGFITPGLVKEVRVNEGDKVKAGDVLVVLDAPDLRLAVTAAEAGLRSAQVNAQLQRYGRVKERRNGKIFWTLLPTEFIAIADIEVLRAQAVLEAAQANLAQMTLVAPFDGTVASVRVATGESAQSGEVVLTLASPDRLQVETTDLSERDVTKVHVGDSANVFIPALGKDIQGRVIAISPKADVVGGDVVFKVTIQLDEQPEGTRWGMTAEVNIAGK